MTTEQNMPQWPNHALQRTRLRVIRRALTPTTTFPPPAPHGGCRCGVSLSLGSFGDFRARSVEWTTISYRYA
jgi:hypothetical protein